LQGVRLVGQQVGCGEEGVREREREGRDHCGRRGREPGHFVSLCESVGRKRARAGRTFMRESK